MALLTIELSDAGIIAAGGTPAAIVSIDGPSMTSPGFALQNDHRLMVGRSAFERARLFPQQTISRFWDLLNTEPIQQTEFSAASHAELAYAHLKQIWPVLKPVGDEVVFCVPGHYSRENLGLLLGIARELNIDVQGFVPIALTAVSTVAAREIIHIDLHLHRCEVTYLRHDAELVQLDTASVPDAGLENLYRNWAKTAAREFLQATRFDLFHSAASEQEVYQHLPPLLATLTDHQTVRFEMNTGELNYHMPLQRQVMIEAVGPVYAEMMDLITTLLERNQLTGRPLAFQLSQRACGLPGLKDLLDRFTPARTDELALGAAALGAAACWPALSAQRNGPGPARHTRRPVVEGHGADGTDTANHPAQPTHLLFLDTAYPIGREPLVIGSSPGTGNGVIRLAGRRISSRHCSIHREGEQVILDNHSEHGTQVDRMRVTERTTLAIGQTIVIGEQAEPLRLIHCLSSDASGRGGQTSTDPPRETDR